MKTIYFPLVILIMGMVFVFSGCNKKNNSSEQVKSFDELESQKTEENQSGAAVEVIPVIPEIPVFSGADYAANMPIDSKKAWMDWMRENTNDSDEALEQRWECKDNLINNKDKELSGDKNIRAFLLTPREYFARAPNKKIVYRYNYPVDIGWGATLSSPDIQCKMTIVLDIQQGDKVLEIGTGSGYQSGLLTFLTNNVYTIEIIKPLAEETDALYISLEDKYPSFANVKRKIGDGYYGWEEYAPFDKIIVTCAIDHIPPSLLQQLTVGGIMVIPLGPPNRQSLMEIKKQQAEDGSIVLKRRDVYGYGIKFIPFRNEKGASYSSPEVAPPPKKVEEAPPPTPIEELNNEI